MGLTIISPASSFVQFPGDNTVSHCIHGTFTQCLPVFAEADVAFQFIVQADTVGEADALCSPYNSNLQIGLVRACNQVGFDVEFNELPDRFRISSLQVLYNWEHGFPGMIAEMPVGECFYIRIIIDEVTTGCSNCFERIGDDCFSSVVEYGNDENFGGFNYCNSGGVDTPEGATCDPTVVTFTNVPTISIPYTTSMQDKYGAVPTVQVWIYVGGELQNVGVVATFDAMPPTMINVDFGGVSSGICIIR